MVVAPPSPRRGAPCPLQNKSPGPEVRSQGEGPEPVGSHLWEWFGAALERARFEADFERDPLEGLALDSPKSVFACVLGAWSFVTADRETGELAVGRFRCRSWRCPGCRYDVAKGDFARILAALDGQTGAGKRAWVLLTLTFDPRRHRDRWEAYKAAGPCWQKLRQRLARRLGGWRNPARVGYIAVWEQHASGWPHVHIAVSSPELVAEIRRRGLCERSEHSWGPTRWDPRAQKRVPNWAWKPDVLDELARDCGFGTVSDVQFPRASAGGVAGYFAKLCGELVGCFDQRPVQAPKGFRRLRSSRRMLPPRHQPSGRYLGKLVQRPCHALLSLPETCPVPVPGRTSKTWPPPQPLRASTPEPVDRAPPWSTASASWAPGRGCWLAPLPS